MTFSFQRHVLLIAAFACVCVSAVRAEDASAYDQARGGLDRLLAENDGLRDRNGRLERELEALRRTLDATAARPANTVAGRAVAFTVPAERQTPEAHRTRHVWDFGDGSPPRPGYAAVHVYERPGVYRVTLDGGAFQTVTVTSRPAGAVVVLPPVVGDLRARADTEYVANPAGTRVTGTIDARAGGVTIRGLVFDATPRATKPSVIPGDRLAIIDCEVRSARSLIETNFGDTLDTLLVLRVRQRGLDTLGRYLVGLFGTSQRVAVYDCRSDNSHHEHILRFGGDTTTRGTRFVTVHNSTLANVSHREGGPRDDMGKSPLVMQTGGFGHVEGNTLVGPTGAGPLPGRDGEALPHARWHVARWQDNVHAGGWHADHGLEHATFARSRVNAPEGAILIHGKSDAHGGRMVVDLVVEDVEVAGGRGATLVSVQGTTGGVVLRRVRVAFDPATPAAANPMPALRLAGEPGALGVVLDAVALPLVAMWPRPSVALFGSQNDPDAYRAAGAGVVAQPGGTR